MAKRKASPRRVSKFSLDWKFLQDLDRHGRETGREWLAENLRQIGRRSSVDPRAQFP